MLFVVRSTYKVLKLSKKLTGLEKFIPTSNVYPSFFLMNNYSTDIRITEDSDKCNGAVDIKALTQGDAELEHKLKVIMLEAEVLKQDGRKVPSMDYIKQHHWQELLQLGTRSARRKYLEFLFKTEKKKENRALKKEESRTLFEKRQMEKKEVEENLDEEEKMLKYELGKNSIFLRVRDTTINQFYNNRLIQAMQFGQKLVLDCGYYNDMTTRENFNCSKQLSLLFAENRNHDDPFDLHFCNVNLEHALMKSLHRNIPTLHEQGFPLYLHEQSYLDIFDRSELVYLTPHCREEMTTYDHNAVYIIGAIVDKVNQAPLSLAKAKKENLKMAKLPLDKYLQWGSGSGKSLTINQVASILLDIKKTGDWQYALRHVPRRKIVDMEAFSSIAENRSLPYDKNRLRYGKTWRPKNSLKDKAPSKGVSNTIVDMKEIMRE